MKPFRFRLARVLRLRELLKDQARAQYGAAELAAQGGEAARDAALQEALAGLDALRARRSAGALDPQAVLVAEAAVDELRQRLAANRKRAVRLRAGAETACEVWNAARAGIQGLERLAERDRDRHRAEVEREQNRESDERALSKFGLKRRTDRPDEPDHGSSPSAIS